MSQQSTASTEKIDVKGEQLVHKVKQLFHEGNVRRISINDSDGKTVLEMPVTVGVIGLLVAPSLTAMARSARSPPTIRSKSNESIPEMQTQDSLRPRGRTTKARRSQWRGTEVSWSDMSICTTRVISTVS